MLKCFYYQSSDEPNRFLFDLKHIANTTELYNLGKNSAEIINFPLVIDFYTTDSPITVVCKDINVLVLNFVVCFHFPLQLSAFTSKTHTSL